MAKPLISKRVCNIICGAFDLRLNEIHDELLDSYDLIDPSINDLREIDRLKEEQRILRMLYHTFNGLGMSCDE